MIPPVLNDDLGLHQGVENFTVQQFFGHHLRAVVRAGALRHTVNVMRYITGLLHSNPMMEQLILREQQESIELTNRTVIEAQSASSRSVRGYTVACVIADEIAF